MAKAETTTAHVPRGTKPVSQAFFTALEAIPEANRAAVAKAAQAMIRDRIKMQRDKAKAAAAKLKAQKPSVKKAVTEKSAAKANAAAPAEVAPKASRRPRAVKVTATA